MRTTLTLDPDVAERIKQRVAEQGQSFKSVVNDILRRGLAAPFTCKRRKPFRVIPHSFGFRPGIDPYKLNQLVDELEAREFAARVRAKKKRRDDDRSRRKRPGARV